MSGTGSLQGSPIKKSHPSQDFIHSKTPTPPPPHAGAFFSRLSFNFLNEYISYNLDGQRTLQGITAAAVNEIKTENSAVKVEAVSDPVPPAAVAVTPPAPELKKAAGALAILDPANFTMDGAQPQKQRVSKESFNNKNSNQLGAMKDPSDPLSQLDPLWSLTK